MKIIYKIHNLIKDNYENNNYSLPTYKYVNSSKNNVSDYKLGSDKAIYDFNQKKFFRIYPLKLIKVINFLLNGKLNEIINFINGYIHEKHIIKTNKKFK